MVIRTMAMLAQASPTPAPGPGAGGAGTSFQRLFLDSADAFTAVLVIGSVVATAVILRCLFEIRASRVLPGTTEKSLRRMLREGRIDEMRKFAARDGSFLSAVVLAAIAAPGGADDRAARREAAEMAASEQCASWFRKIEPLNVIGNLGPLVGLAGTVWGMIKAFVALSQSGGQANPVLLSEGIGKALFHTLGGLLLALPALTVFGLYRGVVDRLCTRAMIVSSELVELLPEHIDPARDDAPAFTPVESAARPVAPAAAS